MCSQQGFKRHWDSLAELGNLADSLSQSNGLVKVVLTSTPHKRDNSDQKLAASSTEMVKFQASGCLWEHLELKFTELDTLGSESRG